MSLTIKPNKQQALSIKNQLFLASLPAKKKNQYLKKIRYMGTSGNKKTHQKTNHR